MQGENRVFSPHSRHRELAMTTVHANGREKTAQILRGVERLKKGSKKAASKAKRRQQHSASTAPTGKEGRCFRWYG